MPTLAAPLNDLLRRLHQRGRRLLLCEALTEKFAFAAARDAALTVPDADLQCATDEFRRHGLLTPEQTHAWLPARAGCLA